MNSKAQRAGCPDGNPLAGPQYAMVLREIYAMKDPDASHLYGWLLAAYGGLPRGICPAQARLAAETGWSPAKLRRVTERLQASGWLRIEPNAGLHSRTASGRATNRYILTKNADDARKLRNLASAQASDRKPLTGECIQTEPVSPVAKSGRNGKKPASPQASDRKPLTSEMFQTERVNALTSERQTRYREPDTATSEEVDQTSAARPRSARGRGGREDHEMEAGAQRPAEERAARDEAPPAASDGGPPAVPDKDIPRGPCQSGSCGGLPGPLRLVPGVSRPAFICEGCAAAMPGTRLAEPEPVPA